MRIGVFLIILHSQFSILNSLVTEDDFARAAGVKKVMVETGRLTDLCLCC